MIINSKQYYIFQLMEKFNGEHLCSINSKQRNKQLFVNEGLKFIMGESKGKLDPSLVAKLLEEEFECHDYCI